MKVLFLLLLLPSLLFTPDAIDENLHIQKRSNGIFKVRPSSQQDSDVLHTDKQVYNLISDNSLEVQKDTDQ